MPAPQRAAIQSSRRAEPRGFVSSTYQNLTSPENASVVKSVVIFGAAVAFFQSSFSELLLPSF